MAPEPVELSPLPEGDRRTGVPAALAHPEAKMLAVAHRRQVGELAPVDEQRHAGIAEPERREPRQLGAQAERQLRARDDRIDAGRRCEVVVGQHIVGIRRERRRERIDTVRVDRKPCGGPVSAVPFEVGRARLEGAVQVERPQRPARALPAPLGSRNQHDRPVVALDEPRGDDADHAFVPVLARSDVAALPAPRFRPGVDLLDGVSEDPLLDHLSLAVQPFELLREPRRFVAVVGEQQRKRSLGAARVGPTR